MVFWPVFGPRILRSDVYIRFTFLMVLGFIGLTNCTTGRNLGIGLGLLFFLCLFGCILLRKFGHTLIAPLRKSAY